MIVIWVMAALGAIGMWLWIFFENSWITCRYNSEGKVYTKRINKAEAAWTATWIILVSLMFGALVYFAVGGTL